MKKVIAAACIIFVSGCSAFKPDTSPVEKLNSAIIWYNAALQIWDGVCAGPKAYAACNNPKIVAARIFANSAINAARIAIAGEGDPTPEQIDQLVADAVVALIAVQILISSEIKQA